VADFSIPGSESNAMHAYDDISDLIRAQEIPLEIERLWNKPDDRCFLALAGHSPSRPAHCS